MVMLEWDVIPGCTLSFLRHEPTLGQFDRSNTNQTKQIDPEQRPTPCSSINTTS